MCMTLPEVLVTVMGIEKLVPDLAGPRGLPPAAAALVDRRADEPVHVALDRRDAPATARRSSTSCCSTTAARDVLADAVGRAGAALHPLLGLPEHLPGLRAHRRPRLRLGLPRPDRRDPHAAARAGSSTRRRCPTPRRSAARATTSARSRSTSRGVLVHLRGRVVREADGAQPRRAARRWALLARVFASRAALRARRSGLRAGAAARCRWPRAAARARSPRGRASRELPELPRADASASGGEQRGVTADARDAILRRASRAALRRRARASARRLPRGTGAGPRRGAGRARSSCFAERVADYRATVRARRRGRWRRRSSPRLRARTARGGSCAAGELPAAWLPPGVELVPRRRRAVGRASSTRVDGVLTGCAAGDRRDRHDRARRRRRAAGGARSRSCPTCTLRRPRRRRSSPGVPEAVAALHEAAPAGRPITMVSGPVGDVGHRARPRRGRPRPAPARGRAGRLSMGIGSLGSTVEGSSSCDQAASGQAKTGTARASAGTARPRCSPCRAAGRASGRRPGSASGATSSARPRTAAWPRRPCPPCRA